jgi:hypothetical protein
MGTQNKVGVWIDHEKAVIAVPGQHSVTVVPSELAGHTRFSGGGGYPGGNSSQGGRSERREEEHHRHDLNRYFDAVIAALGHPEALLILGPGEAKTQLQARLEASTSARPAVTLVTADKLTDAQIAARVSSHFTG